MKLVESFLRKNPCFASDREITVKGLMLQSVGCPQPSAKVFLNNWNRASYNRACPHALVDAIDGTIYQTLPWTHRGWHAETIANDNYIGVIMCEPTQIKYTGATRFNIVGDREKAEEAVRKTYRSSVALFAMLCYSFNLDPASQIYSHVDLTTVGSPITQKDPEHLWSQLELPFTMNTFRSDVRTALDKIKDYELSADEAIAVASGEVAPGEVGRLKSEIPAAVSTEEVQYDVCIAGEATSMVSEAEPVECVDTVGHADAVEVVAVEPVIEDTSFEVRIPVANLRIRKGPGVGEGCEPIGKYTGIGVFRILEVQNGTGSKSGWGRLASGEGWVCMDFVERI